MFTHRRHARTDGNATAASWPLLAGASARIRIFVVGTQDQLNLCSSRIVVSDSTIGALSARFHCENKLYLPFNRQIRQ